MSECTHPADQIQVITSVGLRDSPMFPQLLWCRACGAVASGSGGRLDVQGYKEVPPRLRCPVEGRDDWHVPEESGPDTWGPEATKVVQRERELRLELEAEVAGLKRELHQERKFLGQLPLAELVAENETLKRAALQDQRHRFELGGRIIVLEVTTAVRGGEWCAENRAAGRGPCGACAWCCKEAFARAEAAECRVKKLEADIGRLRKIPAVNIKDLRAVCQDEVTALEAECEERAETMREQVKEIHRLEGELEAACRLNLGVEVGMPPAACCVLCNLPIIVGGIRGMGDGSGNRFAHEVCYWRKRAEDAETVGDYADDLRDRVCLQDDNKVLQLKVEEMRGELAEKHRLAQEELDRADNRAEELEAELAQAHSNLEALCGLHGEMEELAGKLAGSETMQKCYSEELTAISNVVPPGEHDRHLTHQGALLQRVEDLMARHEYLEDERDGYRGVLADIEGQVKKCGEGDLSEELTAQSLSIALACVGSKAHHALISEDRVQGECAEAGATKAADEKQIYYQDIEALKTAVASEKARRVYYQDIVYAICLRLDLIGSPGKRLVCGTVEEPSQELQEAMVQVLIKFGELKKENARLKEIARAAHSLAQKIKDV